MLKQSPGGKLASAQIWVVMAIANNKLDSWATTTGEEAELHFLLTDGGLSPCEGCSRQGFSLS